MLRYFSLFIISLVLLSSCEKEQQEINPPVILFKSGEYTANGEYVPIGGKLTFGIVASTGSAPLTNLRVQRVVNGVSITEIDKGMFVTGEGLEQTINAVKSGAEEEIWRFMVMNANRDSAVITRTVLLGEGSAYGPIKHFETVRIGMQDNQDYPHFLNLSNGDTYTETTVVGYESVVDLIGFVYYTGGKMSPTLSCPGYATAAGYYPAIGSWVGPKSTLYDYQAVDDDLVDHEEFTSAINDSLLVNSYNPQSVSGNCKYCYTGKIIPFKTQEGKYGLIRVLYADEVSNGYMDLEIKVQE
ncbi:MAG: hypothetical protein CVT98_05955 [Bacteroidetes bacterium HGW-Bacteroidetes-15]|nr:MAG: hypothetical protein CVT98_05955 [Bacteroidetes bacterium HGW-Bacteroidetes-15]